MSDFDLTGTPLELCNRPGCLHYRAEHDPVCKGLARGPDGIMIPGTRCDCPKFVSAGRVS